LDGKKKAKDFCVCEVVIGESS